MKNEQEINIIQQEVIMAIETGKVRNIQMLDCYYCENNILKKHNISVCICANCPLDEFRRKLGK